MQVRRYDILFNGSIADGFELATVKANLAAMFKLPDATVDKLFSGESTVLKKNIDRQTAIKYQNALHKAGARIQIKLRVPEQQENTTPSNTLDAAAAKEEKKPFEYSLSLAPAEGYLLRNNEQHQQEEKPDVDISHIKLLNTFMMEHNKEESTPAAPLPDTSHLSAAAVGEDLLPEKPAETVVEPPDTSDLSVAPAGSDVLTEDQRYRLPVEAPDVSAISLAPEGSDLLREEEKAQTVKANIDTSKLVLADDQ